MRGPASTILPVQVLDSLTIMSLLIHKMKKPRSLRSKRSIKSFRGSSFPTTLESAPMPSIDVAEPKPVVKPQEAFKPGTKVEATLDGMPDELKICILQEMPDLDTLFTFLSASVSYDCCYARYRQPILQSVLLRELGPEVFFEARAVVESRKLKVRQGEARMNDVKDFLTEYEEKKELEDEEKWMAYPLDVSTLLQMTTLHYHIGVITYNFARTTLSIDPVTGKLDRTTYERDPPSKNETRRIQRAIYRFELFVVLFRGGEYGMWYPESYQPDAPFFDPVDITEIFFSVFNTWEVAEIGCIRDFVMGTFDRIFRQCGVELEEMEDERDAFMTGKRRHPASIFLKHCARKMRRKGSYLPYPLLPPETLTPSDSRAWRTTHKKEFCMSQGLALLHEAARAQTPAQQVSVLEPYYYDWYGGLSDALSEAHDFFSFRTANALAAQLEANPLPLDPDDPDYDSDAMPIDHTSGASFLPLPSTQDPGPTTVGGDFWDALPSDEASSFSSTFSNHDGPDPEKVDLPNFIGDEASDGPNAIWPLTLGFCWDRWLRHWGYVMWDLDRLRDMKVMEAPYFGRRCAEGSERRVGTMSLVWKAARAKVVSPLTTAVV